MEHKTPKFKNSGIVAVTNYNRKTGIVRVWATIGGTGFDWKFGFAYGEISGLHHGEVWHTGRTRDELADLLIQAGEISPRPDPRVVCRENFKHAIHAWNCDAEDLIVDLAILAAEEVRKFAANAQIVLYQR